MITKKSHPKGHHYTHISPLKPRWKAKDLHEPRQKAKNRIEPHGNDHISSFIGPYRGLSYYMDH